jgi:hypothetical protein
LVQGVVNQLLRGDYRQQLECHAGLVEMQNIAGTEETSFVLRKSASCYRSCKIEPVLPADAPSTRAAQLVSRAHPSLGGLSRFLAFVFMTPISYWFSSR